jgi:hypothetical protein
MSPLRHIPVAVAAVAAAVCAATLPARAAAVCGEGIYSYAGLAQGTVASGVRATIGQAGPLDVHDGHVAGWIGVVDPRTGAAWLQAGLSAFPGDTTSTIYYEVAFPGKAPVYHELRTGIGAGEAHRFAVLELPTQPDWWQVWVDGRPTTPPLHLRGSHGRWIAQALGESWAGAADGACNGYAYGFSDVSLRLGSMRQDPNYAVVRRSASGFVAASASEVSLRTVAGTAAQPPRSAS